MKKIIATFVLAMASLSVMASDLFVSTEYDYHRGNGDSSHFGSVGIAKQTEFGTFDAILQAQRSHAAGTTDSSRGFEVGYSYALPVGSFTLVPKMAYGQFNGVDTGTGTVTAKYWLPSVEVQVPLNQSVNGFVGVSRNIAINGDMSSYNRVIAGADFVLNQKTSLRVGGSFIRQQQANQRGIFAVLTYAVN